MSTHSIGQTRRRSSPLEILVVVVVVAIAILALANAAPALQSAASIWLDPENNLDRSVAPAFIVALEDNSTWITVFNFLVLGAGAAWLFFIAPPSVRTKVFGNATVSTRVITFIGGIFLGAATGVLWAVWNPILILPPFIHLRLFAFLPGVIALLFGPVTGFLAGYVGSMVWATFTPGAFVPPHTLGIDGLLVGLLTGSIYYFAIRGGLSRRELLDKIEANPVSYYLKCTLVTIVGGLLMSFGVAASLNVFTPLSFWASFVAIGLISDSLPMLLVAFATHRMLRLQDRYSWAPTF